MASGVERVQIITERYDSSNYMCGSALAFSNEKSNLWSSLCTELVAFNFIWGSFEALALKFIVRVNSDSTTYLARKFISKYYKEPVIYGYNEALNSLLSMLVKQLTEKEMLIIEKEPVSTKGLFLVSKLRNQFAHGSRIIPLPDDWSNELTKEVDTIQLSSRIVLYTIQMMLLVKYGSKGYTVEDPQLFDFVELEDSVSLDALIKRVHIRDYS
ncbi:hypothetical protein ACX93W_17000 [Paenibacillus sp. CAU 1782]